MEDNKKYSRENLLEMMRKKYNVLKHRYATLFAADSVKQKCKICEEKYSTHLLTFRRNDGIGFGIIHVCDNCANKDIEIFTYKDLDDGLKAGSIDVGRPVDEFQNLLDSVFKKKDDGISYFNPYNIETKIIPETHVD